MRISSWAAMTKRHRGRQWHCRTGRTFKLDYASPPQATQWPDGRSKHIGQWLRCGHSIPRYGFPALIFTVVATDLLRALFCSPQMFLDLAKECTHALLSISNIEHWPSPTII